MESQIVLVILPKHDNQRSLEHGQQKLHYHLGAAQQYSF